jgi:ATP-dependent Lhr-like helicase
MGESRGYRLLSRKIHRWLWEQKWTALRDIQEQAIEPILSQACDVIISASTAAGKTEAAFLPALSKLTDNPSDGLGIMYISPLKALINDQFRRLEPLGKAVELPITPWHGDVPQSVKNKLLREPKGVILITPESLESILLNKGSWCRQVMGDLRYIIIDEFHAFVGSERGRQLQSLLRRLDFLLERIIPRLALSATLGDMGQIAHALRPQGKFPYQIIESKAGDSEIQLQIRGYVNPADINAPSASDLIADDLFHLLRGGSHLVFADSRQNTESYALALSDRCRQEALPNEFFPHHGSLTRALREDLEKRLQKNQLPTTAVCTMTLELGIDIGHVNSIAQIGPPQSVASLRQRLGRSGRRGEAAALRFFVTEEELSAASHLGDRLRLEMFQSVAMVNLLLKKWCEPANTEQYHFSTLVQQTLSVIGQYGGVRASQLWSLLCGAGPFELVSQQHYSDFLRALGEKELITQTSDSQLVLGRQGERLVSRFTFYSAFNTPEEYHLEHAGRPLGSLPIISPLSIGQQLVFAGKRWEVLEICPEAKRIALKPASGGRPPRFSGSGQMLDDIVRQEMLQVYIDGQAPLYLNKAARDLFSEGLRTFHDLDLENNSMIEIGQTIHMLPWLGDRAINAITVLLRQDGINANCFNGIIDIKNCTKEKAQATAASIAEGPKPTAQKLAAGLPNNIIEKHDYILPDELRCLDYGGKCFDVDKALAWLSEAFKST